MKILIADDTPAGRMVLSSMLRKESHTVLIAEDGSEAVDVFKREQPEIVIMDIMMPVMDGYEATRHIKKLSGQRFVPVIFLTAMSDEEALVTCVKYGGDDFLAKPYNPVILKAKLDALNRIRELHAVIKLQNEDLTRYRDRLDREQELAGQILTNILHAGSIYLPNLKYRLSPANIMNGDLLFVARRPTGTLHVMLGDITGHGLSSAICAMPAAEVFYDMTTTGYPIGEIAATINQKLKRVLPVTLFCAACLLEVDHTSGRLTVWNGGLPDVLVWSPREGIRHRFASQHLPLGIVNPDFFNASIAVDDLRADDRIYLYTDGLIEATNREGAMFGQDRLEHCLRPTDSPDEVFDAIQESLSKFCGSKAQEDDIGLVELPYDLNPSYPKCPSEVPPPRNLFPTKCHFDVEFTREELGRGDLLATLTPILDSLHLLPPHKEAVSVILKELLDNALDHGVLGLDSSLKNDSEGFAAYYESRQKALAELEEGWIKIRLAQGPSGVGRTLTVRVEDSGPGFDYQRHPPDVTGNIGYCGRGIPLIRSLSKDLTYSGCGNIAEAAYAW